MRSDLILFKSLVDAFSKILRAVAVPAKYTAQQLALNTFLVCKGARTAFLLDQRPLQSPKIPEVIGPLVERSRASVVLVCHEGHWTHMIVGRALVGSRLIDGLRKERSWRERDGTPVDALHRAMGKALGYGLANVGPSEYLDGRDMLAVELSCHDASGRGDRIELFGYWARLGSPRDLVEATRIFEAVRRALVPLRHVASLRLHVTSP